MAAQMLAKATKISIYPTDGRWIAWPQEQQNMELLWHDVCRAALQSDYIKDADLQAFQSVPRKPFGVQLKDFVGNVQGKWTENGVWLVAYPLLTADDGTWLARLDIFYFFTDEDCTTHEYVKNPVLTIQHSEDEGNTWDHISLAYDRDSKSLRLTPGDHLDEIDLVRHISIDIDKYKHRDIFPKKLSYKDRAAAERASLMGSSASNFQEEQTDCKNDEQKASEAPAALSVGTKRNRPIILEDSEDEHDPPGSSSSGHKKVATTGAKASAEVSPASDGQQAGNGELEKALQKVKALEAKVRQQELQIARPSSTTTDTGAHTGTEGNPTPGDGSSERNRQQARDRELEKALQKNKTLEAIVREQGVEITELKLRLADGQ